MKRLLVLCLSLCFGSLAQAQSYYTLIQGGANIGFSNEGYKGSFNGYSASFVFGRNYKDSAYLGLGIGNERFKGTYQTNDPHQADQKQYDYDQYTMPIFVDGRLAFGEISPTSKLGLLANVGYAPSISAQYDKGFLFKGGFFYLNEVSGGTNWTFSASYGYQQLTKNIQMKDFQHQHFNLTVGLMFK